jgi:CheY-like chemotaxis protein
MDGDVTVKSEFGHGSVFTATITQTYAQGASIGVIGADSSAVDKPDKVRFVAPSARILIADDIQTNLLVAEGLLSPYKLRIDTCLTGTDAVRMTRENRYDFILMDHMMPEMDGIEATAAIRAIEGEYFKHVPIIALTANAILGMREMFLENGFDDYLTKPIEISKLHEIMKRWIPKEKREKPEHKIGTTPPENGMDLRVEGLDTARGIAFTGGTEERYRRVLELYCRDASERLEIMRQSPDEDDMSLFTTHAHALKSASASIGAEAISKEAARLEELGKSRDIAEIRKYIDDFRDGLGETIREIQEALKLIEHEDVKDESGQLDESLLPKLKRLKDALEGEQIGEVDKIIEEFNGLSTPKDIKKELSSVSDYVLTSELKGAVEIVDRLLQKLRGTL